MQWSRPDNSNAVRDMTKLMDKGDYNTIDKMYICMEHCMCKVNCGITL